MKTIIIFSIVLGGLLGITACQKEIEPPYEVQGTITATISGRSWKTDWKSNYIEVGPYFNPKFYRKHYNNTGSILSSFTVHSKGNNNIILGFSGWGCDAEDFCGIFKIRGRLAYHQNDGVVATKDNIYFPIQNTSYLEIIDADTLSLTIEGRFGFEATSRNSELIDTVRVTNGYFKLTFPQN
jgi:hypothetical protein